MKIEIKQLSELQPADYNPRKDLQPGDPDYEKLKRSIEEFGYVEPIIWNARTGHVVGGHQRLKILQEQGIKEAECVIVDFDESKEKALNIALNKITNKWDKEKLLTVLDDLSYEDFDIELTGFKEFELHKLEEDKIRLYYGDEVEKTFNSYRLDVYDETRTVGYYQFPKIKACHVIPDDLIGFNYARSYRGDRSKIGIHFFLDDYQFERLWSRPYENIEILRDYQCVLAPDFSTYRDMPMAMRIWNLYRIYMMTQMMQDAGLQVIPILRDLGPGTYDWSLEPIESGGVVAVSTIGHVRKKIERDQFADGWDFILKKIAPSCVIMYGVRLDVDFGDIPVKYIKSKSFQNGVNKK